MTPFSPLCKQFSLRLRQEANEELNGLLNEQERPGERCSVSVCLVFDGTNFWLVSKGILPPATICCPKPSLKICNSSVEQEKAPDSGLLKVPSKPRRVVLSFFLVVQDSQFLFLWQGQAGATLHPRIVAPVPCCEIVRLFPTCLSWCVAGM